MYTVTYKNKHTGNYEIAGYKATLRGAKRLAKIFKDGTLADETQIYRGQAGAERVA